MQKKTDIVNTVMYYKARRKGCSEKKHVLIYKKKIPTQL